MATTAEIERVEAKIIAQKGAKSCDKYDYLTAVGCGVVAGLVDSFFVGMPGESKLGGWTDAQVDKAVMNFAKICGWTPHAGKENSVSSAIGFLERNFRVNYDQKNSVEAGTPFKMSPSNHHMKSLAHSPDIVGLFFSITSLQVQQPIWTMAASLQYRQTPMNCREMTLFPNCFAVR